MTRCEKIIKFLPALRAFIAKELVYEYKSNQLEAAQLLGVTQSAISQYVSDKRGRTRIRNIDEVKKSCTKIYNKESTLDEELCRLCKIMIE
ncbi:MAG: transcriptional regulator [Candidatus Aenigmatarchaeota archaeon]